MEALPVRTVAADLGFLEGPVILQSKDLLVVSIDRGHVYRIPAEGGTPDRLVNTGGGPNGAAEAVNGDVYIAQNGGVGRGHRRATIPGGVQVLRPDGRLSWVTLDPVAPNDLCFGPDGLLYATDPTRDRRNDGRLWRIDVDAGEAELLTSVDWYPNGIGFGPDADALYVASTGDGKIWRFPITTAGIGKPELFVSMDHGHPDGFAFDVEGNLSIAAVSFTDQPGDVQTWSSEGMLLDIVNPGPDRYYTNVAITSDHRMLICGSDSGELLEVGGRPYAGLRLCPFREKQATLVHSDLVTKEEG